MPDNDATLFSGNSSALFLPEILKAPEFLSLARALG